MDLIPLQTYITPAQDRAVKRLAQQQGATEAEIIRKAPDLLLFREGIGEYQDSFDELIGLFTGPSEVNHTESNGRWVYHIVDTAFMRAWLNHPRFRMIK